MSRRTFLAACLALAACACGGDPPPRQPAPAPTPLTLAEWQAMTDVVDKYDPGTLERLKLADPTLNDPRVWQRLMNEVITPARDRDIPRTPEK